MDEKAEQWPALKFMEGEMSGGSYDYAYYKVEDMADSLRNVERDPRRASFQKLLRLVSTAMHNIEWVDSCDWGKGDENKAIDDVFDFLRASPEIIKKAHAFDQLKERLQEYFK